MQPLLVFSSGGLQDRARRGTMVMELELAQWFFEGGLLSEEQLSSPEEAQEAAPGIYSAPCDETHTNQERRKQ